MSWRRRIIFTLAITLAMYLGLMFSAPWTL
jgi:hypothetical protein